MYECVAHKMHRGSPWICRRPAKPARACKKQRREAAEAAAHHAEPANGRPGALVWLRQDLRLHDNAAIAAAAAQASASGGTVTFAFVHSLDEDGDDFRTGEWAGGSAVDISDRRGALLL